MGGESAIEVEQWCEAEFGVEDVVVEELAEQVFGDEFEGGLVCINCTPLGARARNWARSVQRAGAR